MKKFGLFLFVAMLLCTGVMGCDSSSGRTIEDASEVVENENAKYEGVTSIQCIENYNAWGIQT